MKAVMLYRPNTEFSRITEEYVRDFEHQRGTKIELVNLDTPEGADMVKVYDMPEQPTLMVLKDDGQLMAHWPGTNFPLANEVAAYLAS